MEEGVCGGFFEGEGGGGWGLRGTYGTWGMDGRGGACTVQYTWLMFDHNCEKRLGMPCCHCFGGKGRNTLMGGSEEINQRRLG